MSHVLRVDVVLHLDVMAGATTLILRDGYINFIEAQYEYAHYRLDITTREANVMTHGLVQPTPLASTMLKLSLIYLK